MIFARSAYDPLGDCLLPDPQEEDSSELTDAELAEAMELAEDYEIETWRYIQHE